MEIGEEISKKIRSAIKAKLVDQGAYVDDELPDYIMVMVANRKTQPQMTEDLNLFLGNHTDAFTTWLHGLLEKLQSITADPPENSQAQENEKPVVAEKSTVEKQPKVKEAEKREKEKADKIKVDQSAEPVIQLNPEHDEFEEVSKATEQNDKSKSKDAKTKRRRSSADEKRRSHEGRHATSTSKSSREKDKHLTKSSSKDASEQSARGSVTSRESRGSVASRLGPRRKAGVSSSVGAVIKHDVYESDEEYDPLNPSVGAVASIVKVTERKSSLPIEKQANKSLLLKAMSDAEKSVTTKTRTSKAVVKPTVRKSSADDRDRERDRDSKRRDRRDSDRDRDRHHPSRHSSSSHHASSSSHHVTSSSHHAASSSHTTSRSSSTSQRVSSTAHMRSSRLSERSSIRNRLGGKRRSARSRLGDEEGRSVQIVKKVKQELKRDEGSPLGRQNRSQSADPVRPKRRRQAETIDLTAEEEAGDSRRIEYAPRRRSLSPVQPDTRNVQSQSGDEAILETLIESGAESDFDDEDITEIIDSDPDMDSQDELHLIHQSIHAGDPDIQRQPSGASPKFVVTLDGVDPNRLADEAEHVLPAAAPAQTTMPKNVVMVRPQPPMVEPMVINPNEIDEDEEVEMPDISTKTVKGEKCRFWPACSKGDQCPYAHPTTPCTNFPNCRFGERCLYIHPDCKFDAACTRPNCAFSHKTKRSPSALAPPPPPPMPVVLQPIGMPLMYPRPPLPGAPIRPRAGTPAEVTCRFFPKCTNMNCPFKHPKPCRFGISCTNKAKCRYAHPALPAGKQLRWTPQAAARAAEDSTAAAKLAGRSAEESFGSLRLKTAIVAPTPKVIKTSLSGS